MSLTSFPQLPGTPSMRLTTARDRLKVPSTDNSAPDSATPSPTLSVQESRLSAGFNTSISDPDDYVDTVTPQTVTPAPMKSRSTTSSKQSPEPGQRRASGRRRKPTVKAQALTGEKTSPSQLLDTIVIGGSPPGKSEEGDDHQPSTPPPDGITLPVPSTEMEIPETPAQTVNDSATLINGEEANDVPSITSTTLRESPTRRQSRRERKPTAKILETSPTNLKRPAPDEQDQPPRKSARISYSGAKVPSRLRYSVSSASTGAPSPETIQVAEPTSPKKSKVVVLKIASWKAAASVKAANAATDREVKRNPPRRVRKSTNLEGGSTKISKKPSTTITMTVEPPACLLTCLPPSSRLFAMAQIAAMMPDSDDEDGEIIPGSAQDWTTYTARMCQCHNIQDAKTSRTNSVDLQRALEPNALSTDTQFAPYQLFASPTPAADFLATPVNTILKAEEAQRVKELFSNNALMSASNPFSVLGNDAPVRTRKRTSEPFARPSSKRARLNGSVPATTTQSPGSMSSPAKSSYENRLQRDHLALSDIRKRATLKGIKWTFNMSFEEIQALLMEVEALEDDANVQKQARGVDRSMAASSYSDEAASPSRSRSSFGMLFPPQTSMNGALTNEISWGRRASSTTARPRPRVDPRGLLGESPGPGTIINIESKRRAGSRAARQSRIH
ncbi:uncharacterized protein A1O9_01141 [Exophiala aquamarina CBS 119918]|uniref:Uncharacterized protein n=1 Tax=Exophiala aquamarina CBS 119918 TaxID=1182545 RepID=A0A072Q5F6_9EURO|nr:uncharacterized protein A1O9_01141 [Exophiala aquamarina CBS 119918]KEF63165.1 hypothetical protein A1O9_01141 [Exophiala aquamarina CBS 119918]